MALFILGKTELWGLNEQTKINNTTISNRQDLACRFLLLEVRPLFRHGQLWGSVDRLLRSTSTCAQKIVPVLSFYVFNLFLEYGQCRLHIALVGARAMVYTSQFNVDSKSSVNQSTGCRTPLYGHYMGHKSWPHQTSEHRHMTPITLMHSYGAERSHCNCWWSWGFLLLVRKY